jgi:hypothetical protein
MKFNICTVQPFGYIHSRAFDEIAVLIEGCLKDLGCNVATNPNKIDGEATNIIIGCHLLDPSSSKIVPKDSIIINTEQLSPEIGSWNQNILFWLKEYPSWDYSKKNIEYLRMAGFLEPRHLLLGYHKTLDKISRNEPKDVDVLFYGSLNERRKSVLEQLIQKGLVVKHLFGTYGAERDQWIARSKIVLNMHYFETKIFEIVRCFYLMINAKAVVSEISPDTSIDDIYRTGINGKAYEKIVDECCNIVNSESLRKNYEGFAESTIKKINSVENIRYLLGQKA